jgi:adenylosuccinate lyase
MLHSISPIDGRYQSKTKSLSQYFSEYALIKYRVFIELEYLKELKNVIPALNSINTAILDSIFNDFSDADANRIKEIEKVTNHDVKAVEYFLRDKLIESGLQECIEFIHFGLTSQDINNTSFPLMTKDSLVYVILPTIESLIIAIQNLAEEYPQQPMLAYTHGQPATPTTFKKEMYVFIERLSHQLTLLKSARHSGKFGGATGNFNAHKVSYPEVDWNLFAEKFLQRLGLNRLYPTTQISHYDDEASLYHTLIRLNTILIDFSRDIWMYISMNFIKQKTIKDEVGSSAMPHKVNPIDFENAEGNLMLANSIFGFLAEKLPVSRLQRDLTDSTVLRNIGVPFAHSLISYQSLLKGISKLSLNIDKINIDLNENVSVLAEAIQTILRREGIEHPYELLKGFTRGKTKLTLNDVHDFIEDLPIDEKIKMELKSLSPTSYIGYAD